METISLNGDWRYRPDPHNEGLAFGYETTDNDTSDWKTMSIPSNWELAGLHNYCGVVWFTRTFQMPEGYSQRRLRLRFEGLDYNATVWINGRCLGDHAGDFQPFEFDISPFIQSGENLVTVRAESPREYDDAWPGNKRLIKGIFSHHDGRPGGWSRRHGQDGCTGGIWGSVNLLVKNEVRLANLRALTSLVWPDEAAIQLEFEFISDASSETAAALEISLEPENFAEGKSYRWTHELSLKPGEWIERYHEKVEGPKPWNTWDRGTPHIYRLECLLKVDGKIVDRCERSVGFRSLNIDDHWHWQLNGKPFFPRGTNFIPTQWLSEYSESLIKNDIEMLQSAFVNAIRITGHVNRPELLEACDLAGILVWQDFALQWGNDGSADFRKEACRQIQDLVRLVGHHPCLALWCCHNKPRGEDSAELDSALAAAVHELDDTRKIVPASSPSEHAYTGWYTDDYRDFDKLPGRPMVTDFGAQALPCRESLEEMFGDESLLWPPSWPEWVYRNFQYDLTFNVAGVEQGKSLDEFINNSQEYQALLLKYAIEHYRMAMYRGVEGIFQYSFVDSWPSIGFSVIDYFRRPKLGYRALQVAYQPLLPVFIFRRRQAYSGGRVEGILTMINDTDDPLENAELEFTLEVEKGTLITWMAKLKAVPPHSVTADAIETVSDDFCLPTNMTLGPAHLRMRLFDSTGARIAENVDTMKVVPPPPV